MADGVKPPHMVGVDTGHAGDAVGYALYGGGMGGGKAFGRQLSGGPNLQSVRKGSPQEQAISQRVEELLRDYRARHPSITQVWVDEVSHVDQEGFRYALEEQAKSRLARQTVPAKITKPIDEWTDAELIMEMIRRGYAAMKLPEAGGPPEVLKNS